MSLEEQLRNDAQSLREVGWFNRAIMMNAAANEIQKLNERIKRLEEAGDAMLNAWLMPEDSIGYCDWVALSSDAKAKWFKAKEAKP